MSGKVLLGFGQTKPTQYMRFGMVRLGLVWLCLVMYCDVWLGLVGSCKVWISCVPMI